ncbi:MAG: tetratricopeptide repeat protein [Nitrospirae bacterium]|nr:tetratricopeptide repeat protein [Nitrospirota bacterium]
MEKETSEIAKLTERIAKDPKSKLFVPLAEEHKKAGDLEMAIQVLTEGLRSNPGYVTARSFLGRLLMDKGDLTGAQKELEEVIKAIPDNLLAQRKLGDLYVLQGRSGDALQRYKAALALNPSDKELPSLLADLEAGKDISARVPRPKALISPAAPKSAPAPAAPLKPSPVPSSGAAKPAGSTPGVPPAVQKAPTPAPAVPKIDSAPAAPAKPVAEPRPAAPPPPAPPAHDEAEVIEEIVEIEHLEQPGPAPEVKAPAAENAAMLQPEPAGQAAETAEMPAFDLSEAPAMASTGTEDLTAVSWGAETFIPPEESKPAETAAAGDEGGDDLNTDTLAELYISQGFYDKAVEIYQGMLEEQPQNKALQQKLEELRAMASTAESGVEGLATAVPGKGEYTPAGSEAISETRPAVEASTEASRALKNEVPRSPEPSLSGTAPQKTVTESVPDSTDARSPQAAMMRRKETIDRLESWLKNIMKEKES